MSTNQQPNTSGKGCLYIFLAVCAFFMLIVIISTATSGSDSDCYHTPGAAPGSAQDQRDVQHCIQGR